MAARDASRAETTESVQSAVDAAVTRAVADTRQQASAERDAAVQAALEQAALLQREQFQSSMERQTRATGVDHDAGQGAARRSEHADEGTDHGRPRREEGRHRRPTRSGPRRDAHRARQGDRRCSRRSARPTRRSSARSSRRSRPTWRSPTRCRSRRRRCSSALANPQARGQWGERMAEDVLRLAGFVENVNYRKQTQIEGGTGRPDYTFHMPKGQTAVHGRQVPDGGVPALSRAEHRRRARGPPQAVPDRRARTGEGAGQAGVRDRRGRLGPRQRLAVHPQRTAHRVHPRARPRHCIEDAMGQQIVMCSPTDPVRLPRRDPPGPRQLHDRADQRRDPVSSSASSAHSGPSTPTRWRRSSAGSKASRRTSRPCPARGAVPSSARCVTSRRSASSATSRSTASCSRSKPTYADDDETPPERQRPPSRRLTPGLRWPGARCDTDARVRPARSDRPIRPDGARSAPSVGDQRGRRHRCLHPSRGVHRTRAAHRAHPRTTCCGRSPGGDRDVRWGDGWPPRSGSWPLPRARRTLVWPRRARRSESDIGRPTISIDAPTTSRAAWNGRAMPVPSASS